ncbi:Uncharacterised protein [Mycobacteroides abscessus subsp. abscessus]|nr:Uncharacterised protein [Mycobacteroides abscessus subsp. abscessus]
MRLPDSRERADGVGVEFLTLSGGVERADRVGEHACIRDGEIESFCACRRNDVRGVAEQEQRTELHGLGHHAAQGCEAAIDDLAGLQGRMIVAGAASGELGPDRLVAPVSKACVGGDLEILPAQVRSAHAVNRQSVRVGAVHALFGDRCGVRQNAQPGKGIRAFKGLDVWRHRRASDAVEAIARRDDVGVDVMSDAIDGEFDGRCAALEIVHGDVVGGEDGFASGRAESVDEVGDDLGLSVDVGVARRQSMEVEVVCGAIEADVEPFVYQRLTVEAVGNAQLGENVDRRILDDSGTHP